MARGGAVGYRKPSARLESFVKDFITDLPDERGSNDILCNGRWVEDMTDRDLGRRTVLRGMAAMSAMPALATSAGAGGHDSTMGPSGVHVAYGTRPSRQLTVGWTGAPAAMAKVEYWNANSGTEEEPQEAFAAAAPVPGRRTVAYSAELQTLDPATEYKYKAVTDHGTAGPFGATTAPDPGGTGGFTVTAVGDHGVFDFNNPVQRVQDDDPEDVIDLAQETGPDFHLCVGDISYANGHPTTWEEYFATFEDFYANTPFLTVPGNHEVEPGTGFTQYDRRLNDIMPIDDPGLPEIDGKQRWYDFQYGNTLFVGLNTSADACWDASRAEALVPIDDPSCQTEQLPVDVPPSQEATIEEQAEAHLSGEDQAKFLEETLSDAERADDVMWKVVYFHGPMWTTSPDHPDRRDLREVWGEYLHRYNVDLVMSGDNHIWERTKPIVGLDSWNKVGEHGTTFVTNGTGGTSHYPLEADQGFTAARSNNFFGITQLDVVPRLAQAVQGQPPPDHADSEAIVVQYKGYETTIKDENDTEYPFTPLSDRDIPDDPEHQLVDEFAIVKDAEGRPVQLELGESVATASP